MKKFTAVFMVLAVATMCVFTSCDNTDEYGSKVSQVELKGDTVVIDNGNVIFNVVNNVKNDSLNTTVEIKNDSKKINFNAAAKLRWSKNNYEVTEFSDEMSGDMYVEGGEKATSTLINDNNLLTLDFTSESKKFGTDTYTLRILRAKGVEGYYATSAKEEGSTEDSLSVKTSAKVNVTLVLLKNGAVEKVLDEKTFDMVASFTRYAKGTVIPELDVTSYEVIPSFSSDATSSTGTFVVITKVNGEEKGRQTVAASGINSLTVAGPWTATEANYNQSTSSVVIKSQNSEEVRSGEVVYTKTTTVYTTTTKLNNSTKTNTWTSVTSNNFRYVGPDGTTYTAKAGAETATADGGNVTSNGQYSNVLTKSFNGTAVSKTATGNITKAEQPTEPEQPFTGDLAGQYKSSGVCAVIYGDSWRYGVAITTTAGTKVFAINQNGTLVEGSWYGGDTYSYNCSYEYNGTLVPCVAKNGNGRLVWTDKDGTPYRSISDTAWQARAGNNNKNSVYTDDYKVTVTKDGNHNVIKIVSAGGQVLKTLTDSSN